MNRKILFSVAFVLLVFVMFGCVDSTNPTTIEGFNTPETTEDTSSTGVITDDSSIADEDPDETDTSIDKSEDVDTMESSEAPAKTNNEGNDSSKAAVEASEKEEPTPKEIVAPIITDSSQVSEDVLNFALPYENKTKDIRITGISSYNGYFAEKSKNTAIKSGIMIEVENISGKYIYWGKIELKTESGKSMVFDFSYMKPGAVFLVQENREQTYDPQDIFDIEKEPSIGFKTQEDVPWITQPPGILIVPQGNMVLSVQNKSTIPIQRIQIFYKNKIGDKFAGGITYMIEQKSGLLPEENWKVVTGNYTDNSEIVHVIVDYDVAED